MDCFIHCCLYCLNSRWYGSAVTLPVIKEDFGITQLQAGALGSYTLIGMGIGGIFAGLLADRIGRVKVTIASLIIFSLFTVLLGFTQTYWQFALVRFCS